MTSMVSSSVERTDDIPKRIEEALFYRLKNRAFKECDDLARAYADCCRGRTISLAWSCRPEAKELSKCLNTVTSRLEDLKHAWVRSGKKTSMDETQWQMLLDEVIQSD